MEIEDLAIHSLKIVLSAPLGKSLSSWNLDTSSRRQKINNDYYNKLYSLLEILIKYS